MKHTDPKDGRSFIEATLALGPAKSRDIAAALDLQVFQITAKLKSLSVRGFLQLKDGLWIATEDGKQALTLGFITFTSMSIGGNRAGTPPVRPTDEGVRVITAAPRKEGWKTRWHGSTEILIDPDGAEYTYASASEKADLIYHNPEKNKGISPVRWKLLHNAAKLVKKEQRQLERAKASAKARKQDRQRKARRITSIRED